MNLIEQHFFVITEGYEYFASDLERIARICYKSEHKITPISAEPFMRRIIRSGHEAMLEHANLSIQFITDRATANAIVRHRHCAFAQESTHYIDYQKRKDLDFVQQVDIEYQEEYEQDLNTLETLYFKSKEKTKMRRTLFALGFKTEIVVTTNLREWRHILKLRTTNAAHPQMRDLMRSLLYWFKDHLPIFVEDIEYET
jgi:thymidylate synthase (FAD)